jgi:hypothetical protein
MELFNFHGDKFHGEKEGRNVGALPSRRLCLDRVKVTFFIKELTSLSPFIKVSSEEEHAARLITLCFDTPAGPPVIL